jgi:hypothetical protein
MEIRPKALVIEGKIETEEALDILQFYKTFLGEDYTLGFNGNKTSFVSRLGESVSPEAALFLKIWCDYKGLGNVSYRL